MSISMVENESGYHVSKSDNFVKLMITFVL